MRTTGKTSHSFHYTKATLTDFSSKHLPFPTQKKDLAGTVSLLKYGFYCSTVNVFSYHIGILCRVPSDNFQIAQL